MLKEMLVCINETNAMFQNNHATWSARATLCNTQGRGIVLFLYFRGHALKIVPKTGSLIELNGFTMVLINGGISKYH